MLRVIYCTFTPAYCDAYSGCNGCMADEAVRANDEAVRVNDEVSELLDHFIDRNAYRIPDSKRQRNISGICRIVG